MICRCKNDQACALSRAATKEMSQFDRKGLAKYITNTRPPLNLCGNLFPSVYGTNAAEQKAIHFDTAHSREEFSSVYVCIESWPGGSPQIRLPLRCRPWRCGSPCQRPICSDAYHFSTIHPMSSHRYHHPPQQSAHIHVLFVAEKKECDSVMLHQKMDWLRLMTLLVDFLSLQSFAHYDRGGSEIRDLPNQHPKHKVQSCQAVSLNVVLESETHADEEGLHDFIAPQWIAVEGFFSTCMQFCLLICARRECKINNCHYSIACWDWAAQLIYFLLKIVH